MYYNTKLLPITTKVNDFDHTHLFFLGSDGATNEGHNPHLLVLILTMLQCQLVK